VYEALAEVHAGDNFEGAANKRLVKHSNSTLDTIDPSLESSAQNELKKQYLQGMHKVNAEKQPLDQLLDNLGDACVKVMDSHIDKLAWKYKPKLELAKEKVAKLEIIVKNKQKQREKRE